jgi:hypothetical protein
MFLPVFKPVVALQREPKVFLGRNPDRFKVVYNLIGLKRLEVYKRFGHRPFEVKLR